MALALLQEQQKAGLPVGNAGHLLLGFLKYYGRVFDLEVGGHCTWHLVLQELAECDQWAALAEACLKTGYGNCTARCQSLLLPFAWHLKPLRLPLQAQAVAVKQGGVVAKEAVATATAAAARGEGAVAAPPRLCVEDPLTGRDVAGGTNRIAQVRQAAARGVCWVGER
jgi:hypothetical protein